MAEFGGEWRKRARGRGGEKGSGDGSETGLKLERLLVRKLDLCK